jgi:hypothetical protein
MQKKNETKKKALKVKTNVKPGVTVDFSTVLERFVGASKDLLLWPWGGK